MEPWPSPGNLYQLSYKSPIPSVLQALKKQWHDLAAARPGHRFQNHYRREHQKRAGSRRPWKLIVGITLIFVGMVLMVLPGPGVVFLALGGAFLAGESQVAARGLDTMELYARRLFSTIMKQWRRSSSLAKVFATLVLVTIVATSVWLAWTQLN